MLVSILFTKKKVNQTNVVNEGLPVAAISKPLHQTKPNKHLKSSKEIDTSKKVNIPSPQLYQMMLLFFFKIITR